MSEKETDTSKSSGLRLSPVVLIRICSVLFIGLMVGHISAYPWASARTAPEAQLVRSMKSVDFVFFGEHQTYWGLYFGWGVLVAVLLLVMAVTLWLISDLAQLAPGRIGAITGLFSVACLYSSYLSFRFFYLPPGLFYAVTCLLFLAATVQIIVKRPRMLDLR